MIAIHFEQAILHTNQSIASVTFIESLRLIFAENSIPLLDILHEWAARDCLRCFIIEPCCINEPHSNDGSAEVREKIVN